MLELYFVDTFGLILFGAIYALIIFLTRDIGTGLYNNTVKAFFFPIWAILLYGVKSPALLQG